MGVSRPMSRIRDDVFPGSLSRLLRRSWWEAYGSANGPGMRLGSKILLSSALVIAVLMGVSALSLAAVGRLVTVNRDVISLTIPAMSLTAEVREAILRLRALEARNVVLSDARYATAWNET